MALHDRDRREREALRWLGRYLGVRAAVILDDVTIAVTCLRALRGHAHAQAHGALRSAVRG